MVQGKTIDREMTEISVNDRSGNCRRLNDENSELAIDIRRHSGGQADFGYSSKEGE